MAAHLFLGRFLSVFLLVLLGLAGTARADHFLTHPAATPQGAAVPQVAEATPQAVAAGPQAVKAAATARDARTLFEKGKEIKIKRDAKVYITPRNIPKNDRFLKSYSADKAVRSTGTAVPGLLDIATETYRTQGAAGTANQAYSLADAMRDAVWRKTTAAKLKSLMSTQRACAGGANGTSRGAPSIGLGAFC